MAASPNGIVRGFISEKSGDNYDYRPQIKEAGGKEVYEINISQSVKDEDSGERVYVNVRVSVWGRAIPPVKAVVDKILSKPQESRPQIAFEGEWQDSYTSPKTGKVTWSFRAFDASPWFSAYR